MNAETTLAARPVLEVRNLVTEFATAAGILRAVDDVSIALYPGRTLCVVGESGSGKSVLSRSVLQIVDAPGRIVSGEAVLRIPAGLGSNAEQEVDILRLKSNSPAMRSIRGRHVAMIFQEPMSSLSPIHRIGDQISEAVRLHEKVSRKVAWARAVELLGQVGIENAKVAAHRYPFEYSGGMRQRAMIAMALACDPAVLIADEPTTALDVTIQAEILELIARLQRERNMAVLFITHDMGVVANIADEVVVMRGGKMLERGDVYSIFENPTHAYTRELIDGARNLDRPSPIRLRSRQARAPGEPIVVADKLRKEFYIAGGILSRSRTTIVGVDDVSLSLRAGENLGIVGESGSGKTTLARCIQRAIGITGGEVSYTDRGGRSRELAGLSTKDMRPVWRDIRTVFQDPFSSLNPRMTVGQIIAEPLVVEGRRSAAEMKLRVQELLEMVELPPSAAERFPHAFSGGQRQRIAIARAICPNPRVIIADEPTSALDVSIRTKVLDLLLRLQERMDVSYIFVSHDMSVVRYFCDRVAVMYKGRLVEVGEAEQICTAPREPYTQALVSAVLKADPERRRARALRPETANLD